MADENSVSISQEAIDELMRDAEGPVGDLMRDLSEQMAQVAREKAPILKPKNIRSYRSSALRTEDGTIKMPGYLKRNITSTVGHSKLHDGYVFAGANAPGNPDLFLEIPAEQMHEQTDILQAGLWSVHVD